MHDGGAVISVHEHELRNDVDATEYEREVSEIIKKLKVPGLLHAHLLKGFKGKRRGSYAVIWVWKNKQVITENFGTLDNPKWPEDWLYYENEILAKYLTCHPDKINFTCYDIMSDVTFVANNANDMAYSEGVAMYNEIPHDKRVCVNEIVNAWQNFLKSKNWKELIAGVTPKHIGCGIIYELPNFLNRAHESFAIADMREILFSEPHYHPHEDIEIYFVLQGTAHIVVGKNESFVSQGDVIIIPPNTAHFTIPDNEFVIAAVNTPPFKPEHYIVITETNPLVDFDQEQFIRLSAHIQRNADSKNVVLE